MKRLAVLGVLHAVTLFIGDILLSYAIRWTHRAGKTSP